MFHLERLQRKVNHDRDLLNLISNELDVRVCPDVTLTRWNCYIHVCCWLVLNHAILMHAIIAAIRQGFLTMNQEWADIIFLLHDEDFLMHICVLAEFGTMWSTWAINWAEEGGSFKAAKVHAFIKKGIATLEGFIANPDTSFPSTFSSLLASLGEGQTEEEVVRDVCHHAHSMAIL
jgi:hypothetical protein